MLYTGKGDDGTTKLFNCPQGKRVSKADFVFEVLGMFDELNSSLGYAKVLSKKSNGIFFMMGSQKVFYEEILEKIQQNLFCIQAEIGGSNNHATKKHILYIENVIHKIEKTLPPIISFIIYGGGEVGAYLDIVRALARKVERQLIILHHKNDQNISNESIIYMNRLSSVLYALARFANYQEKYFEKSPDYQ